MQVKIHKNAKTTLAIRKEIKESNESIYSLVERYNLNWNTVKRWKTAQSLEDKSSRPHKLNISLSQAEEELICFERKSFKKSIYDIYLSLEKRIPNLNPVKIYRCLKRHNLNSLPPEFVKAEKIIKKFRHYTIGYLHLDVLYAPKINKKRSYIFACIDRVSKIAYVEVVKNKTMTNGKKFLDAVLKYYPYKINYILTDNGQEFCYKALPKSKRTKKEHLFVKVCRENKINHRTIKFRHPWTNGQIERLNGKIKSNVFYKFEFHNIFQLEEKLIEYINNYNFNIKLRGLKFQTPAEYIRNLKNIDIKPIIIDGDLNER